MWQATESSFSFWHTAFQFCIHIVLMTEWNIQYVSDTWALIKRVPRENPCMHGEHTVCKLHAERSLTIQTSLILGNSATNVPACRPFMFYQMNAVNTLLLWRPRHIYVFNSVYLNADQITGFAFHSFIYWEWAKCLTQNSFF